MASNINPYLVDGTFPIAGQDNSSQGFRNNFTNIQNNFQSAASEISDLQSKALLISALNGQSLNNDLAGTQLIRPQLSAWTQTVSPLILVQGSVTLSFTSGNYQLLETSGPISISFANWPSGSSSSATGYGVMRVAFEVVSTAHTVTLPSSVTVGIADIPNIVQNGNGTWTMSFDAAGTYIFDFSSYDGGSTYQVFDLTRNRATFRAPSFYLNNITAQNPTLFIGYNSATLPTAEIFEIGQDVVSTNGSLNSVSVGNLSLANVTLNQIDTSGLAGYSITSARGNLNAQGYIQPVQSGDYLGYINSIAFTGNGTANVFQQVSSINFFVTGSNVAYGLGGNIAFFTADDGGQGPNKVNQALGVENDQSVKAFGNLSVAGKLTTSGGIVNGATYVTTWAATNVGNNNFVGNINTSTVIIDSALSVPINQGNIQLPARPADRQTFKIVSVAPITSANVYTTDSSAVRYVPTTKFSSGNAVVQLTYISSASAWYLS